MAEDKNNSAAEREKRRRALEMRTRNFSNFATGQQPMPPMNPPGSFLDKAAERERQQQARPKMDRLRDFGNMVGGKQPLPAITDPVNAPPPPPRIIPPDPRVVAIRAAREAGPQVSPGAPAVGGVGRQPTIARAPGVPESQPVAAPQAEPQRRGMTPAEITAERERAMRGSTVRGIAAAPGAVAESIGRDVAGAVGRGRDAAAQQDSVIGAAGAFAGSVVGATGRSARGAAGAVQGGAGSFAEGFRSGLTGEPPAQQQANAGPTTAPAASEPMAGAMSTPELQNRLRVLQARLRDSVAAGAPMEVRQQINNEIQDVRRVGALQVSGERRDRSVAAFGGEENRTAAMRAEGDRILSPEFIADAVAEGEAADAQIGQNRAAAQAERARFLRTMRSNQQAQSMGLTPEGFGELEQLAAPVQIAPDLSQVNANDAAFRRSLEVDRLARRLESEPALREAMDGQDLANMPLDGIESINRAADAATAQPDPEVAAMQTRAAAAAQNPARGQNVAGPSAGSVNADRLRVQQAMQRDAAMMAQSQSGPMEPLTPEMASQVAQGAVQTAGALAGMNRKVSSWNPEMVGRIDAAMTAIAGTMRDPRLNPQDRATMAMAVMNAMGVTSATVSSRFEVRPNMRPDQVATYQKMVDLLRMLESAANPAG